jgi:Ca-activated chloride channel homolog
MTLRLNHPEFLWLLLLLPLLAWLIGRRGQSPALVFPTTLIAASLGSLARRKPFNWLFPLRLLALACVILAIARPQLGHSHAEVQASGIDIMMAIDVSTSMNALDFRHGGRETRRIDAVKIVGEEFIRNRPNDRIALMMFASKPYLMTPLTLDHEFLLSRLYTINTGIIEDGTAIGTALARSLRRITDRESASKIVILLTDGENNAGPIAPLQAADIAANLGIRVYTIGAGSRGVAPIVVKDRFGRDVRIQQEVNIDEETLTQIAELTGGKYYRATDLGELQQIYREIDQLEKSTRTIQGFSVNRELFPWLLLAALALIAIEVALANTRLLKLP